MTMKEVIKAGKLRWGEHAIVLDPPEGEKEDSEIRERRAQLLETVSKMPSTVYDQDLISIANYLAAS